MMPIPIPIFISEKAANLTPNQEMSLLLFMFGFTILFICTFYPSIKALGELADSIGRVKP